MPEIKRKYSFLFSERGLFATLFALYLIATSALTYLSFRANQVEQLAQTRSMLLTAARSGSHIIGLYFHDIYNRHRAPGDVHYRMIVDALNALVADLPDIEYVYSMDIVDGKPYFIVSNETKLDLQRGTPSLFYNPYGSAPVELFQAKQSGEPVFTSIYTNEWGSFRSAFVPSQRSDGTTYIMAADVRADGPNQLLMTSLKSSSLVVLLSLLPIYPLVSLYRRLQRQREDDLETELYYDPVTGLPRITRMEIDLAGQQPPFSGILINLDEFHAINTLFGYDTGNHLLVRVADTVQSHLPSGSTLYRSQADEYFILLSECDPEGTVRLTQQLLNSIFEPIRVEDKRQITVTARSGIVVDAPTPDELLLYAREAMDQARRSGKDLLLYDNQMRPETRYEENLHWLNTINDAFRQGRVVPWFQPILDIKTGEIDHYEALARLIDTDGQIHTPYRFLPAIRKSHLHRQLTGAIVEQSFALFSNRHSSVSINLTRFDLLDRETIDNLIDKLDQYGMRGRVTIEVLESESIDYQDEVLAVLKRCKQAGMRIAIDDFGSGYSNFDQMLKIDADYLKIDGELIKRLHTSVKARALIEAVTRFAASLRIPLIAEFVEDQSTADALKALGVEYLQGYAIGKPAPGDELEIR